MIIESIRVSSFWLDDLSNLQRGINKDMGREVKPEEIKHIHIEPDPDSQHNFCVTAIIWQKKPVTPKTILERDTYVDPFHRELPGWDDEHERKPPDPFKY